MLTMIQRPTAALAYSLQNQRILSCAAAQKLKRFTFAGSWSECWSRPKRCHRSLRYFSQAAKLPGGTIKVAIVGSGPSGCYVAKYLQSTVQKRNDVNLHLCIDVLERLPTPYGLVRFGVAPDHPEVKNVQNDFDNLFTADTATIHDKNNKPAASIRFFGNVNVGHDVKIIELRQMYDIVVLAYGCDSERKLNLLGSNITGVLSAREFVAWYNGHPDFVHIGEQVADSLTIPSNNQNNNQLVSVVIIGNGNVALDCARILAKGRQGLHDTDISKEALDVIEQVHCNLESISIIGRRGHVQGAFTIKEVRELVHLQADGYAATFVVDPEELNLGMTPATQNELANNRPKQRIDKLLRDAAASVSSSVPFCKVRLRFLLNPVQFNVDSSDPTRLASVRCERTILQGEVGEQRAIGTQQYEIIPTQLALISIGYKGIVIDDHLLPWFDSHHGLLKHDHGRIDSFKLKENLGALYATGWIKRGPTGIIGTNIADAKDTVATIMYDIEQRLEKEESVGDVLQSMDLLSLLNSRNVKVVDWEGYQRINKVETSVKRSELQPREKITDKEIMLNIALS